MRFAPAIGGEQLLFDFDKFSSITASVYADSPYSLAEVLEVFRYYFEQYEAYTGAPANTRCTDRTHHPRNAVYRRDG